MIKGNKPKLSLNKEGAKNLYQEKNLNQVISKNAAKKRILKNLQDINSDPVKEFLENRPGKESEEDKQEFEGWLRKEFSNNSDLFNKYSAGEIEILFQKYLDFQSRKSLHSQYEEKKTRNNCNKHKEQLISEIDKQTSTLSDTVKLDLKINKNSSLIAIFTKKEMKDSTNASSNEASGKKPVVPAMNAIAFGPTNTTNNRQESVSKEARMKSIIVSPL